jgi:hypothetical protein
MQLRDLPWMYLLKVTGISVWIAALFLGALFNSAYMMIPAVIIAVVVIAHIFASDSPDYQEFIYRVKLWRENGGGR